MRLRAPPGLLALGLTLLVAGAAAAKPADRQHRRRFDRGALVSPSSMIPSARAARKPRHPHMPLQ